MMFLRLAADWDTSTVTALNRKTHIKDEYSVKLACPALNTDTLLWKKSRWFYSWEKDRSTIMLLLE